MIRNYLLTCLLACFLTGIVGREAILDGIKAVNDNEFPYQVIVRVHGRWWWEDCGGGILDDTHILTAARCVVIRRQPRKRVTVVAGTSVLNRTNPTATDVTREVTKIYVPKDYMIAHATVGDIAVLELKEPLGLSKDSRNLRALNPPSKEGNENYFGRVAIIAGFGFTSLEAAYKLDHKYDRERRIRYAKAQVINSTKCQQGHRAKNIHDKLICTEILQHDHVVRSVCPGDTGGPLVLKDKRTVIGVLGSILPVCNVLEPTIYTSVFHYMDFVVTAMRGGDKNTMEIYILCENNMYYD